ncbi:MAG: transcriptional repressor NrdR [Thermoplasmata archaeon]|jgi:transcriptional repressor NrdR|nr:transcriptional repressor NrdR [Thermoplasmata archaeon]
MKCPSCDCHDTRVIDSRETRDASAGVAVRRRRQCVACEKRFTTYERYEVPDLRVRKRDDRVEDFDRDKIEIGVMKACEKRPIAREDIVGLLDAVEEKLRALESPEVPSTEIGAIVLEQLKLLDPVAYLRFASVYKDFGDVSHFEKELKQLRQETLAESLEKVQGRDAAPRRGKR